jgi:hypothetical protein
MAAGFTITKADIDARAGQLVVATRDDLYRCAQFCDLLNDTSIFANDAALTALGYSGAEVTMIRASFTDLKSLYNVSHAAGTVPSNNDFWFNAKHLTGVV